MRLPFQRGLPPRSPLASLLSTPGLVALYLPYLQVAQSLTGQTLLDYSGNANHATLGSTTGADTNDPTWGTSALAFGGDDYCGVTGIDAGTSVTRLIAFKTSTTINTTQMLLGGTATNQIPGLYLSSDGSIKVGWSNPSNATHAIYPSVSANTWYAIVSTLSQSSVFGVVNGSISDTHTPTGTVYAQRLYYIGKSGYNLDPAYVSSGVEIALVGHINRVVSVSEAVRLERNIETLLTGQGVTFS